ncbi:MAG: hypothetical protein K0Q62_286 [Phenylobacterium sp.]|nr:hypothetical protein [Phenylobacterium sp.]
MLEKLSILALPLIGLFMLALLIFAVRPNRHQGAAPAPSKPLVRTLAAPKRKQQVR